MKEDGFARKPVLKRRKKFKLKRVHLVFALIFVILIIIVIKLRPQEPYNEFIVPKKRGEIRIYLSAAVHETDNPCSFSESCGENIHCNLYMDVLEKHLGRNGFSLMRNPKHRVGDGIFEAVKEANAWKADLYYVAHTNAYDGEARYSLIMPDNSEAYEYASVLKRHRETVYPGEVLITVDAELYESRLSDAPTLYDEVAFHDQPEDVKWFHENYQDVAENTAKAICEMFGFGYIEETAATAAASLTSSENEN